MAQFRGDTWDELIEAQDDYYDHAKMIVFVRCRGAYIRSWEILGRPDDAVQQRLDYFGVKRFNLVNEPIRYLAAYWRQSRGYCDPPLPDLDDTLAKVDEWLKWLAREVEAWPVQKPWLVRQFCRLISEPNIWDGLKLSDAIVGVLRLDYPIAGEITG